jgi:hypothetical protein
MEATRVHSYIGSSYLWRCIAYFVLLDVGRDHYSLETRITCHIRVRDPGS